MLPTTTTTPTMNLKLNQLLSSSSNMKEQQSLSPFVPPLLRPWQPQSPISLCLIRFVVNVSSISRKNPRKKNSKKMRNGNAGQKLRRISVRRKSLPVLPAQLGYSSSLSYSRHIRRHEESSTLVCHKKLPICRKLATCIEFQNSLSSTLVWGW